MSDSVCHQQYLTVVCGIGYTEPQRFDRSQDNEHRGKASIIGGMFVQNGSNFVDEFTAGKERGYSESLLLIPILCAKESRTLSNTGEHCCHWRLVHGPYGAPAHKSILSSHSIRTARHKQIQQPVVKLAVEIKFPRKLVLLG